MDPEKIELHDARLINMRADYSSKGVVVEVDVRLAPESSERSRVRLIFEGLRPLSQLTDFDRLAEHASAGNINYWVPVQHGTSFIYLSDGCLAINAKSVRCERA
jgi:hypothetical protein